MCLLQLYRILPVMWYGKFLNSVELGEPTDSNRHLMMIQKTIQTANRASGWVCTHFPEHSDKGVPVLGILLPANIPWNRLGGNRSFERDPKIDLQEWNVDNPRGRLAKPEFNNP